eukprot:365054-Chlamydomonas_euryale.AAC.3
MTGVCTTGHTTGGHMISHMTGVRMMCHTTGRSHDRSRGRRSHDGSHNRQVRRPIRSRCCGYWRGHASGHLIAEADLLLHGTHE